MVFFMTKKIKLVDGRKVPSNYKGRTQKELEKAFKKRESTQNRSYSLHDGGPTIKGQTLIQELLESKDPEKVKKGAKTNYKNSVGQANWRHIPSAIATPGSDKPLIQLLTLNQYVNAQGTLSAFDNVQMLLTKEEFSYLKSKIKDATDLVNCLDLFEIKLKSAEKRVTGSVQFNKSVPGYKTLVLLAVFNLFENPLLVSKYKNDYGQYRYESKVRNLFMDKATGKTYLVPEEYANRSQTFMRQYLSVHLNDEVRSKIIDYISTRWKLPTRTIKTDLSHDLNNILEEFYGIVPFTKAITLAKQEVESGFRLPIDVQSFANLIAYGDFVKGTKPLVELPPYWLKVWEKVLWTPVAFFAEPSLVNEHETVSITPALIGNQGDGKSTFVRTLGLGWTSSFSDIRNSDKIHMAKTRANVPFIELAEMGGTAKADINNLKAFQDSKSSEYRQLFQENIASLPVRATLISTGNTPGILRDETGERRNWPLDLKGRPLRKVADNLDELMLNLYGTIYLELESKTEPIVLSLVETEEDKAYKAETYKQTNKREDKNKKWFLENFNTSEVFIKPVESNDNGVMLVFESARNFKNILNNDDDLPESFYADTIINGWYAYSSFKARYSYRNQDNKSKKGMAISLTDFASWLGVPASKIETKLKLPSANQQNSTENTVVVEKVVLQALISLTRGYRKNFANSFSNSKMEEFERKQMATAQSVDISEFLSKLSEKDYQDNQPDLEDDDLPF